MEAVAFDSLCRIAPRNGKYFCDARHGAVKRGVEAGHLRQLRMTLLERLDQRDLARQVLGVIRRNAAQFREQLRRDALRGGMLHAMHDAMPYRLDQREGRECLEQVQQEIRCRTMVGGSKAARGLRFCSWIVDDQIRTAQTDAIDLSIELPAQRLARLVGRKPDA